MTKTAMRLRAIRLAAGYVVGKDASEALGIPYSSYRSYENANVPMTDAAVHAVVTAFGVGESFVRTGEAATPIEQFAKRLAEVLEAHEKREKENSGEAGHRLRQMRIARGYRTATSAAQAMGWSGATYAAHENGFNEIPLERLIGYSLSLGARPEYAVLGQLPMKDADPFPWKDLRASGERKVSKDATAWSWLRSEAGGIPTVAFDNGRLRLTGVSFGVLAQLMPGLEFSRATTYALVDGTPGTVLIVDTAVQQGVLVQASAAGITIHTGATADTAPTDPLRKKSLSDPVLLGGLVCRISMQFEMPESIVAGKE